MANASEISVGVSHELAITACKAGFEPKDFASLAHSEDKMAAILGVLRGTHEIRPINHLINLALPCKLPFNGAVRVSPAKSGAVKLERRGDDLYLDGKKIKLFRSVNQQGDGYIIGHELRKELEAKGGNVGGSILDYLVAHPELWPNSWKHDDHGCRIYVYFWDDIFRSSLGGHPCVRYGYWVASGVISTYLWLSNEWLHRDPAASVAS